MNSRSKLKLEDNKNRKLFAPNLYVLLIGIFILAANNIYSQTQPYSFPSGKNISQFKLSNWKTKDGLPSNSLNRIIQTQDRYLWISSYDGLIRFDGVNFKVFNQNTVSQFSDLTSFAVAEDLEKNLWVITSENGLLKYDGTNFKAIKSDLDIEQWAEVLYIDKKNRIWTGAFGIGPVYIKDEKISIINSNNQLTNTEINTITGDDANNIYFGTSGNGLFRLKNDTLTCLSRGTILDNEVIRALYTDKNNIIWIGTQAGLFYYDGKNFTKEENLAEISIETILTDHSENMWITSTSGLYRKNPKTKNFEVLTSENGLSHNYTLGAVCDNEGNLWVTHTRGGLTRIKNEAFTIFNETKNKINGKVLNAICELSDGRILFGFDNGFLYTLQQNNVEEYKTQHSIKGHRIRNIFRDTNNSIWISTYGGLLKKEASGHESWFAPENGFPAEQIRLTFEDSKSNLWVGTRSHGLIKIDKNNKYHIIDNKSGLNHNVILSINEDNEGNIWAGTAAGGINIVKNNEVIKTYNQKSGLISDVIFNTHFDSKGDAWVVTNLGISKISKNKVVNFTTNDGLPANPFFDILEDSSGQFWIPTTNSILLIQKDMLNKYAKGQLKKIPYQLYNEFSGLPSDGLTPASHSLITSDQKLFFPSLNGLVMINPDEIKVNNIPPPVYIENLIVDHKEVEISEKINLTPDKKRFTFKFTAICLNTPEKVRYKYKLEGYDSEWTEIGYKTREVSFTNLPYGHYNFKVIACNNSGIWNNQGASLSFYLQPHFYETVWFKVIAIIFIFLIAYYIYHVRVIHLKNQRDKLELLVNERTTEIRTQNVKLEGQKEEILAQAEELQDKNERLLELDRFKEEMTNMIVHDIKNPLNSIINLAQNKDVVHSGKAILNMVMNILDINKYESTKMALNISEYPLSNIANLSLKEIEYLARKKNIELNNFVKPSLNVKIDKDIIERVFINVLTNAVKFTPNNGKVSISTEDFEKKNKTTKDEYIKVIVTDTGIGIPEDKIHVVFLKFGQIEQRKSGSIPSTGIGLTFCKMAIEAHGGEIGIVSKPGEGTSIWFTLPLGIDSEPDKISDENIERKQPIHFSELEKELLLPHIAKLKKLMVYEITEIKSILDLIIPGKNINIQTWKQEIENAVYASNEEEYLKLITIS